MYKRVVTLLMALALCGLAVDAKSRKSRGGAKSGTPGQFDYYLLSLSWAPDFCARTDSQRNSRECATGNQIGFIVHGLWPQNENGSHPAQCAPARPVASDIVTRMLPFMMDAGLIQHEWSTHGTCSGLNTRDYFNSVTQVFQSVRIPEEYKTLKQTLHVSPSAITAKFAAANPAFGNNAFRVSCLNDELQEVRICFSKDLKARACAPTERACQASTIAMRPLR